MSQNIHVPCPICSGTGMATHEDRHAGTNKDGCYNCDGTGMILAKTGMSEEASFKSNVHVLPGGTKPSNEPDKKVVEILEDMLKKAYSGELRCFRFVGQCSDECTIFAKAGQIDRYYSMVGALEISKLELIEEQNRRVPR